MSGSWTATGMIRWAGRGVGAAAALTKGVAAQVACGCADGRPGTMDEQSKRRHGNSSAFLAGHRQAPCADVPGAHACRNRRPM